MEQQFSLKNPMYATAITIFLQLSVKASTKTTSTHNLFA